MEIKLNLIPPERKEEIIRANHMRLMLLWEAEILSILVLCLLILFSIQYVLTLNLKVAQSETLWGGAQYKKIKEYDEFVMSINSKTVEIEKIQKGQIYWSKLFQMLHERVPSEIELHALSAKNYQISLRGNANTRTGLVSFKESLEKDACAEEVNLPFSNLVSKENLDFQINFKMKKECTRQSYE